MTATTMSSYVTVQPIALAPVTLKHAMIPILTAIHVALAV